MVSNRTRAIFTVVIIAFIAALYFLSMYESNGCSQVVTSHNQLYLSRISQLQSLNVTINPGTLSAAINANLTGWSTLVNDVKAFNIRLIVVDNVPPTFSWPFTCTTGSATYSFAYNQAVYVYREG